MLETTTSPAAAFDGDTCADVDGDASHLPVDDLALARVKAGADLEAELSDALGDRAGAADRARRAVERGEEPVAGLVELSAPKAAELPSNESVVRFENLAPARVAELDRRSVDPTMSVKRIVASTRLGSSSTVRSSHASRRNASIAASVSSGCEAKRAWSAPGSSTCLAPGMVAARKRAPLTTKGDSCERLRTSVGTRTAPSTWRTSISPFIRLSAAAEPGLALWRNIVSRARRFSSSALGAAPRTYSSMYSVVPHSRSVSATARACSSSRRPHG